MLTSFGVVVAKGTKSSVLSEVANYIRLLQQQQFRSEMYVKAPLFVSSTTNGPTLTTLSLSLRFALFCLFPAIAICSFSRSN